MYHPRATSVSEFLPQPADSLQSSEGMLKVGFLCPHNPYSESAFSGTSHCAMTALTARRDLEVRVLGPHRRPSVWDLFRRKRRIDEAPPMAQLAGLDAIIGLVASAPLDSICRRTDIPFIHVTDATPGFLRDTYGYDLAPEIDHREARVANSAARTVYSSATMAEAAERELGVVHPAVVPFGVNFDELPDYRPSKPPLDRLELLFVGSDWSRKGGDVAVAVLECLRDMGVEAQLTLVGPSPRRLADHPAVKRIGPLDKTRTRERRHLAELYARAHLLLLPTKADCTPMVLAEAMAFGTPALASDVGGISDLIGRGRAGVLLPSKAAPDQWAARVRQMAASCDLYAQRSEAAFTRARTRLSWSRWAEAMERIAREAVAARPFALAAE